MAEPVSASAGGEASGRRGCCLTGATAGASSAVSGAVPSPLGVYCGACDAAVYCSASAAGAYLVSPRPLSTAEPVTPPSTAAPVPAPPAAPPPAHLRLGPAPRGPAPPAAPSVLKCCLHPKCYYRQHASGAFGGHCCGRCRMWPTDYPYNKPVHGENCKHIWHEPPREASPEVIDVPSYPRPSDTEMAAIVSILSSRAGEILGLGPISAENFQVR